MRYSIIIPAKNEEANIGRCLDSILCMEWDRDDFEIIVVDNGSIDRTTAIALAKGVRLYKKPGCTISALRNFGATVAGGEILAFIDADCTVAADWLRNASFYLSSEEVAGFGSPPLVPENATWVQRSWFQIRKKKDLIGEADWLESMNFFVRKQAFETVGGFNEELVTCEDYDFSLRLKTLGRVMSDGRLVVVHHGEAASIADFLRKEYWRGTSNLKGIMSHGISPKELPSVIFPLAYCLFVILFIAILFMGLLLAWQTPLFLMAALKSGYPFRPLPLLQLYLLLNAYFLARGGAVLQRVRC
jgi:glycosyltransferase involved in cell wall biosynthesis